MARRHGLRWIVYPTAAAVVVALVVLGVRTRRAAAIEEARDRAWHAVRSPVGADAREWATRLVALQPEDPDAHLVLGLALRRERAHAEAEHAWTRALALAGPDRAFLARAGAELLAAGAPERALEILGQALDLGRDAEALRLRALATVAAARAQGRDADEARRAATADCAQALDLAPDAVGVTRVAMTALDLGDDSLLEAAAARIARLDPSEPLAFYLRGLRAERAGVHAEADAALSEALARLGARERSVVDPSLPQLHQWRQLAAELYCRRGRARRGLERAVDAAADCRRAVELEPAWAEAHLALSRALADGGDAGGAEAALLRAWTLSGKAGRAEIAREIEAGAWAMLPAEGVRDSLVRAATGTASK